MPKDQPSQHDQPVKRINVREMKAQQLLEFCVEPRSRNEMMEHIGLVNVRAFRSEYLIPLQEAGLITMIRPDLPTWRHQKYVTVQRDE